MDQHFDVRAGIRRPADVTRPLLRRLLRHALTDRGDTRAAILRDLRRGKQRTISRQHFATSRGEHYVLGALVLWHDGEGWRAGWRHDGRCEVSAFHAGRREVSAFHAGHPFRLRERYL